MRIVIALGGNALLRRGEPMTTEVQQHNVGVAAQAIAPLVTSSRRKRRLVLIPAPEAGR